MYYTKIKIELTDYPKYFSRTIAVEGNPDLLTLGAIIGESVGAMFYHFYLFRVKKQCYVAKQWIEEDIFGYDDLCMNDYHLSDLPENFYYTYDTGEDWEFKCKVYKKQVYIDEKDFDYPQNIVAFILDGVGAGIIEDSHYYLDYLVNNSIDYLPEGMNTNLFAYQTLEEFLDYDSSELIEIYDFQIENVVEQFSCTNKDNIYFLNEEDEENDDDTFEDDFDEDDLFSQSIVNDDENDPERLFYEGILSKVSYDIFNDDIINDNYRRLEKLYDMQEVYDMIVDAFFEAIKQSSEKDEYDEDAVIDLYHYLVKNLD